MKRTQTISKSGSALLAAVLLAACASVGRDYEQPALELPPSWSAPRESALAAESQDLLEWWKGFDDPQLVDLVERALRGGHDLRVAFARLDEARALRGVAAGERMPSIDARASYEARRDSKNTPFGAFISETDIHSLGFDASWELDLWGRVRRSVEAADRDLEARGEDVRDVAISVAAETVRAYVELRSAQRRLAIARENVGLQEQTLSLVRSRLDAGLVGERDVAQAIANVESTRSRVPLLQAATSAAQNRLAVLTGSAPGALAAELETPRDPPRPPLSIAVGVPADLLRRRADVRSAERSFAAEVARIGVAEGDRYPRFSLNGTLGLASDGAADLFDERSFVAGLGPSLRWNLFDGGRLRQRVEEQSARAEAAQARWEQSVLVALEEAENSMTRFVREQVRRAALERAAEQARLAVELAQSQYREGLSDFQTVLDSERVVASLEDELATSDAAVSTNLVALYKALGGGFAPEATQDVAAR